MLKFAGVKEVSKVSLEREKVIEKACQVCNHEIDGMRNASWIINCCVNNGFDVKQVRTLTEGSASEKQYKAVIRCIHGRHYPKSVYNDLIQFLDFPEEFNRIIPIKKRKVFLNITTKEVMKELDRQNGLTSDFTEKEREELSKNF